MNASSTAAEADTRTDPALAYRRLRPGAPVGFSAAACLPLRSRYAQCGRCVTACPVRLLNLTNETLALADGCLGCGRCTAVCPTGALAVAGFSRKAVSSNAAGTVYLDCWKVSRAASPPGAVRVPCLGGLSVGRLLGFCVAAGQRPVALLDRGWCRQCPAGGAGEHPVQAALSATQSWLREVGVPPTRWPQLAPQPLPASDQAQTIPDAASEQPVSRRDFFGHLAHQVTSAAAEAMAFEQAAAAPTQTSVDRRTPVRALERERQLGSLQQLAARHGRAVPAHFFPALVVNADCCNHRLCARLCPTGALLAYETDSETGVRFDAAACIVCGHCEAVCPEKAIRLLPAGNAAMAAGGGAHAPRAAHLRQLRGGVRRSNRPGPVYGLPPIARVRERQLQPALPLALTDIRHASPRAGLEVQGVIGQRVSESGGVVAALTFGARRPLSTSSATAPCVALPPAIHGGRLRGAIVGAVDDGKAGVGLGERRSVIDAKVHCANPGVAIGAMDFNGAWMAMSSVTVMSNASRLR